MASSDFSENETTFVIDGEGPGETDFLLRGIGHLRGEEVDRLLRFKCHPMKHWHRYTRQENFIEVSLVLLGQRRKGIYWFKAQRRVDSLSNCDPPAGSIIEGFYEPSRRKGYFRVVSVPGPELPRDVDPEWLALAEEDRWWEKIFNRA